MRGERLRVEQSRGAATAIRCAMLLIAVAGVLGMSGCFGDVPGGTPPPNEKKIFDILIGVSPESLTIPAPGTTTATVKLVSNSDNNCGLVQLSVQAAGSAPLPNWLHVTFNPSELRFISSSVNSTMTVVVDSAAPAGVLDTVVVGTCEDFTSPTAQVHTTLTVPPEGPAPTITSISPGTIIAGGGAFTLTVNGSNFISSSAVNWNGSQLVTMFVSATQLTAQVPMPDIANPGTATIMVFGPGTSNGVTLTIFSQSSLGIVTVISESSSGDLANAVPNPIIAISANGRYAAFKNLGATNLVSDPTVSQSADIYWHDSCAGVSSGCSLATQLASVINGFSGNGGNDGNSFSGGLEQAFDSVSISSQGRYVGFLSDATNLTVPQANWEEAYLRDTCTEATPPCSASTTMVSLTDTGVEPNGSTTEAAISGTGQYVAFISGGTNLVQAGAPAGEAYIRDTNPACKPNFCTILVSADNSFKPANGFVQGVAVSAKGRFVIFSAQATNLGSPAGASEVFVRDTCHNAPPNSDCNPNTEMVSVDNSSQPAPVGGFVAGISDDGRFVAFTSTDQLAANSLPSPNINLYVRDTCKTETGPVDGCTPATTTASVAFDGSVANAGLPTTRLNPHLISGDGRFVVFPSLATNLTAGGTGVGGIFVHDTCNNDPTPCAPTTVLVSVDAQTGAFVPALTPVISADGHHCAFMVGQSSSEPEEQAVLALTSF